MFDFYAKRWVIDDTNDINNGILSLRIKYKAYSNSSNSNTCSELNSLLGLIIPPDVNYSIIQSYSLVKTELPVYISDTYDNDDSYNSESCDEEKLFLYRIHKIIPISEISIERCEMMTTMWYNNMMNFLKFEYGHFLRKHFPILLQNKIMRKKSFSCNSIPYQLNLPTSSPDLMASNIYRQTFDFTQTIPEECIVRIPYEDYSNIAKKYSNDLSIITELFNNPTAIAHRQLVYSKHDFKVSETEFSFILPQLEMSNNCAKTDYFSWHQMINDCFQSQPKDLDIKITPTINQRDDNFGTRNNIDEALKTLAHMKFSSWNRINVMLKSSIKDIISLENPCNYMPVKRVQMLRSSMTKQQLNSWIYDSMSCNFSRNMLRPSQIHASMNDDITSWQHHLNESESTKDYLNFMINANSNHRKHKKKHQKPIEIKSTSRAIANSDKVLVLDKHLPKSDFKEPNFKKDSEFITTYSEESNEKLNTNSKTDDITNVSWHIDKFLNSQHPEARLKVSSELLVNKSQDETLNSSTLYPSLENIKILVSDNFIEENSYILSILQEKYRIVVIDITLPLFIDVIVDAISAIIFLDIQILLDNISLDEFLRSMIKNNYANKFQRLWIVIKRLPGSDYEQQQTEAVITLCRSISQFPCHVILQQIYTTNKSSSSSKCHEIASVIHRIVIQSANYCCPILPGNTDTMRYKDYCNRDYLSNIQINPLFSQQCKFLDYFPSLNLFIASFILSNWKIKELPFVSSAKIHKYLMNKRHPIPLESIEIFQQLLNIFCGIKLV